MDSGVQDPPGQPTAEELKGLRALFRKPGGERAPARQPPAGRTPAAEVPAVQPIVSRPLVSPHLKADPRLRIWVIRMIVFAVVYLGFMLGLGWRIGLSAAVVYAAADIIYRSKTTTIVPANIRVTSAQRYTSRRLKVLHPAGYLALNARTIPGTGSVIDHLVVGPAGVFSIDSERLDKRLTLRAIGGMLYHGQRSLEDRLDHAREEADHAAKLIGAELGQRIRVHPAMVIYGPAISWVIMTFKGVDVFDGSRVGSYFRRQSKAARGHHLDSSQVAMVYSAAARALPPLR